jgi:Na+-transporting NADH:ubiquinone oxidoreductase subunit F
MDVVFLGVALFSAIVLILVAMLLLARRALIGTGEISIIINGEHDRAIEGQPGNSLLKTLAARQILIPSPCGGSATCGMCKVRVTSGGGVITASETAHINRAQAREGMRLSCMVRLREDIQVEVPPEVLSVRRWNCTVRSNRNVATFIKELVLELPQGEEVPFRAGGYIQLECPPHTAHYKDFDIPEHFRDEWDEYNMWQYVSSVTEPLSRAYSMANYPGEKGILMLNIRIASPPPHAPSAPPGKVSSYVFSLKPGDAVEISGPYGEFHVQETKNEMVFIGGGAGMAPMRSLIFDEFRRVGTDRKVSFWYGARSLREAFYIDDFNSIQEEFENFRWHLALSRANPEDNWKGSTGHIHQVLYDEYLKDHPAPEDVEYYLCGPPGMMSAAFGMLDSLGVEPEHIFFDDFGG